MSASRGSRSPACVACGSRIKVHRHHVGGRRHLIWLTAPLCQVHHDQLHRLLKTAGVDLEYTTDPIDRLIRASKAISILMCMVLNALHEVSRTNIKN
jgi:hypothetical protein